MKVNVIQFFLLIAILLTSLCACQNSNEELVAINGLTMGTSYSIKIVPNGNQLDKNTVHTNIENILTAINQSMSTYINDSELSLFNQSSTRSNKPRSWFCPIAMVIFYYP